MEIRKKIGAVLATVLSVAIFSQFFYYSMRILRDEIRQQNTIQTAEAEPMMASAVAVTCEATYALAAQDASENVGVMRVSDIYIGWDGRTMAEWELELFSRIFYLEFWGTSQECCEAGCDAILRLWETGYFGDTLGGLLSACNESGTYVYSTYAYVWDWIYDADGLAWCRELCLDRFWEGPVYTAPFFQTNCYPWWAIPCYCIDGIYFSTSAMFN